MKKILSLFLFVVSLSAFGQIKIDSVTTDSISCAYDSSGCVTVYVSGFTDSYNISINSSTIISKTNVTTKKISFCGLAPGFAGVSVRSKDGKEGDFSFVIIKPTLLLDVTHKEDSVKCYGDVSGGIELTVKSGVGPFDIEWNTGKKQTLTTPGKATYTDLTTGTYFYTVTDSTSGCYQKDTITFIALDSIVPNFIVNSACVGRPITFTNTTFKKSTLATTYTWGFNSGIPTSATTFGPHNVTYFSAGTKTVSLKISNAFCNVSLDSTINLQAPPQILTIKDTTICIGDTVNLNASGGLSYTWTPNTSLSSAIIANPKAFPNVTTKYIVAGLDSDACVGRDTVTITVNTIPTITASNDTSLCLGSSANLKASGAISYTWSPSLDLNTTSGSSVIATPKVTTKYYVTGKNTVGCSAKDSVLISLKNSLPISLSNDTTICLGDTATLKAIGANTYVWSPANSINSTTNSTTKAFPKVTTMYKVVGTSTDGCVSKDSVLVTVSEKPIATLTDSETICPGDSVQLIAGGGASYSWNNAANLSNAFISNPFAKPTATTTYTVTVSNGTCTDKKSVVITVLSKNITTISKDTTICSGAKVNLLATGGTAYSWAPVSSLDNPNIQNPIASPTVSTEYIVQISFKGSCFVLDTVSVTVNESPNPLTIGDTSICEGDTLDLFTSGGLEYTWTPNLRLNNNKLVNPSAFPLTNTQYFVLIDNKNGCIKKDTVDVKVNPKVTANLFSDKDTICFLDTVKLTASGGITFNWLPSASILTPGSSITKAVPLVNTKYIVEVTGVGSCKDTASKTIVVLTPPSLATSKDTLICSGDTVQIFANGGTTYQWIPTTKISNPFVSNPKVYPLFDTYYVVKSSTGGKCPAVDTVFVQVRPRPNLSVFNDTTICLGKSLALEFNTPGTYLWSPAIESNVANTQKPIFSPTTKRSYFLNFQDASGCVVKDTININVSNFLPVSILGDTTVCFDSPVALSTNVLAAKYTWEVNGVFSSKTPTLTIPKAKKTQKIALSVENVAGCKSTDSVLLKVFNFPTLPAIVDTVICNKDTIKLSLPTIYSYNWSPALEMSGATSNTPKFYPSFTRQYIVTVSDNIECSKQDTMVVTTNAYPNKFLKPIENICMGNDLIINAPIGQTYTSTSINQVQTTATKFILKTQANQDLIIKITSAQGCVTNDTSKIKVNALPVINLANSLTICSKGVDTISAQSPTAISYSWTPTTGLKTPSSAKTAVIKTTVNKYFVEVVDANLCKNKDSVMVSIIPSPNVEASKDTAICQGSKALLNARGATTYAWFPSAQLTNSTGTTTTLSSDTSISIFVVGTQGFCKDTAKINVTIRTLPKGNLAIDDSTLCAGNTANLIANLSTNTSNALGSYSFDNGLTFGATNTKQYKPTKDTTVFIVFRDADFCLSKPISQKIVAFKALKAEIDTINFPECTGPLGAFKAFNFTGGTKAFTYSFNGSIPTIITKDTLVFNNLTQGLYNLFIEDVNNCSVNYPINFLSSIKFDTSTKNISCFGDNDGFIKLFNVSGGVSPYTFGLNQNTNLTQKADFLNLNAKNHTVFIQDASGCKLQANFSIKEPLKLKASQTLKKDVTCSGLKDGEAGITVSGGNPLYTLTGFGKIISGNSNFFYTGLSSKTYQTFVSDSKGCKDTVDITLSEKEDFTSNVLQNSFDCINGQLSAVIDTTFGGSGNVVYSLDFGNTFINRPATDLQLKNINAGVYSLISKDVILGCLDTISFTIKATNGLIVDSVKIISTAPSCVGNDGKISITHLIGGNRPLSFSVLDSVFNLVIKPTQTDSNFTSLQSGKKGIIIRDNSGCKYQFIEQVAPKNTVSAVVTTKNTDCSDINGEINVTFLNGSGNYQIGLNKTATSKVTNIAKLDTGSYTVFYYDEIDKSSCLDSAKVKINNNNPFLEINFISSKCFNKANGQVIIDSIYNQNLSQYSYLFSLDNKNFIPEKEIRNLSPEKYSVYIKQTNVVTSKECTFKSKLIYGSNTVKNDFFEIGKADSIKAKVITTPDGKELDNTGTYWVNSIDGGSAPYLVSFLDTNKWIPYNKADSINTRFTKLLDGTYKAYVKDANQCILTLEGVVGAAFNIPNIFTPNGDGKNDVFFINNLPETNLLRIYDRWGALVYMHRNYNNTWDGNKQADGTYFYELKTDLNVIKGWIQIIR